MNIFQAIFLGIIEGLTEFIPVSSTGHLALASKLMGIAQTDFVKLFEIVIQSGAILAVVPLFYRRAKESPSVLLMVILAFIPTAVAGVLLHSFVHQLLGNFEVICFALIIGGAIIILIEKQKKDEAAIKPHQFLKIINHKEAFLLGCFQALAIIPGVSRSGATIIGGLLRGVPRVELVEFSFLLSVPTIMAAGAFDLIKTPVTFNSQEIFLLCAGGLSAWISAVLCIKAFLRFISHNNFIIFGWYRIAAGILLLVIFKLI